jgi:hypothetical protein
LLDVSTVSPTRVRSGSTALVTCAGPALELRVWPAEDVWAVADRLTELGMDPEPALPDESGLPGSLLVRHDGGCEEAALQAVLDGLRLPGLEVLAFASADAAGTSRRVTGESHALDPGQRDHVVFVELHHLSTTRRWQVRALGTPGALRRLAEALTGLLAGVVPRPDGRTSLVLEVPDRADAVQSVVEHLDAAGLDGHVRVLRQRVA